MYLIIMPLDRKRYIIDLAVLISYGEDDPTTTQEEYIEALELLKNIGIRVPVEVKAMFAK